MKPENAFAFRPEGAPDSWPEKSQRNEAAERLRSEYGHDWELFEQALVAERRALTERIEERIKHWPKDQRLHDFLQIVREAAR